ncbi:MAG TPA: hypothetical protein VGP70_12800 [Actinomadura sp.]|jgi:hypothetical protein|nr:hypothetical protein [Actinomadura sp.]
MRGNLAIFKVPKDGSTEEEYEDAACCVPEPTDDGEVSGDGLRVAVADGASESLLAGHWARLLSGEFMDSKVSTVSEPQQFAATFISAASRWDATVARYVTERAARGKPIKWYEQPGLDRGAYATLIATYFSDTLMDARAVAWHAAALGDSCLFQVRDDQLTTMFPMTASVDFGTNPDLLCSRGQDEGLVAERVRFTSGTCEEGDSFFVCTDALAAWFLNRCEVGERPWIELTDLGSTEMPTFAEWVAAQRSAGLMRNDDVTLVRVDIW